MASRDSHTSQTAPLRSIYERTAVDFLLKTVGNFRGDSHDLK